MSFHSLQRSSYFNYHDEATFFNNLQGWVFNNVFDFGNHNYQNTFIAHLRYSSRVKEIAEREQFSLNPDDVNKYTADRFFSTI